MLNMVCFGSLVSTDGWYFIMGWNEHSKHVYWRLQLVWANTRLDNMSPIALGVQSYYFTMYTLSLCIMLNDFIGVPMINNTSRKNNDFMFYSYCQTQYCFCVQLIAHSDYKYERWSTRVWICWIWTLKL